MDLSANAALQDCKADWGLPGQSAIFDVLRIRAFIIKAKAVDQAGFDEGSGLNGGDSNR